MKKSIVYIIMSAVSLNMMAQNSNVGIGTSTPDASAILELQATDKGILIPRTDTNLVLSPATGLLIYESADNTFYYFDGTYWVAMGAGGSPPPGGGWQLTGDAGTTAGTNFIGTTDAVDFVTKTAGSAATNERLRVTSGGKVVLNNTTSSAADIFSVYGTGTTGAINALGTYAINGYSTAGGTGVYGENTGAGNGIYGANNAGGTGVFGSNSAAGQGVWGRNTSSNGIGVYGTATSTSSNAGSFYASDASNTFSAAYVQHDGSGDALTAVNEGTGIALSATNDAAGLSSSSILPVLASFNYGTGATSRAGNFQNDNTGNANTTLFASHAGVGRIGEFIASNTSNTSDGVFVATSNGTARVINAENQATAGAGTGHGLRAITSQSVGVGVMAGNFHSTGTGIVGYGNNVFPNTLAAGVGGAFTGEVTGVYAESTTGGVGQAVYSNQFSNIVVINYWDGGTQYKIAGSGTNPVSCTVADLDGKKRTMYAPEAPEFLFNDYGEGQLKNGSVHIDIDPILAKNIAVSAAHPLRVFIQLEGDCKGVYVTNKSQNGFDVVELNGGKSNTRFQYQIVANVADEEMDSGRISKLADLRFEYSNLEQEINSIPERKEFSKKSEPMPFSKENKKVNPRKESPVIKTK